MRGLPRRAASASSSACTSSPDPPKTWKKYSLFDNEPRRHERARSLFCFDSVSPCLRRPFEHRVSAFSLACSQRAHRQLVSNHHQRLLRPIEVVELSVFGAREELIAADEQRQRTAVANRFIEADAE